MTFDLIIGDGIVGNALSFVFPKCKVIDKKPRKFMRKVKFMHIAFPYSPTFVNDVLEYIEKHNPEIVIIHSTLKMNTTRAIQDKTNISVIYSPVIGQHNKLAEDLSVFEKWIGFVVAYKKDALKVYTYFKENGLNPILKGNPEILELAKLLSTTRYALNIAFAQEQERICRRHGLDYAQVVLDFEKMFNKGALKTGDIEHMRPFVYPGFIGGHCLIPNIRILKTIYHSEFFSAIERSNHARKKEN